MPLISQGRSEQTEALRGIPLPRAQDTVGASSHHFLPILSFCPAHPHLKPTLRVSEFSPSCLVGFVRQKPCFSVLWVTIMMLLINNHLYKCSKAIHFLCFKKGTKKEKT